MKKQKLFLFLFCLGCTYTAFSQVQMAKPERKAKEPQKPQKQKPQQAKPISIDIPMVHVAGGTFTMGCTGEQDGDCDDREKPAHQMTLSGFYIGKYEVTQAQWKAVMGNNPSGYKGDNLPVEYVNWDDVQGFIRKLNQKTGKAYRLPTEAEWEYAAQGGAQGKGYKYSGGNTVGDVAWYYDNSNSKTHPVGTKQANELGIYDMSGNVYEWCSDWYGAYPAGAQTNPKGASSGSIRVGRGGGATVSGIAACRAVSSLRPTSTTVWASALPAVPCRGRVSFA